MLEQTSEQAFGTASGRSAKFNYNERAAANPILYCSSGSKCHFASIPEALEDLRAGRMLIVVDDEDCAKTRAT